MPANQTPAPGGEIGVDRDDQDVKLGMKESGSSQIVERKYGWEKGLLLAHHCTGPMHSPNVGFRCEDDTGGNL